jgi:hypothetical protein
MIRLALPNSAAFLLAYTDAVPDLPALQKQHPNSVVLLIDRGLGDPGKRATLIDIEQHAEMPSALPSWYDERAALGHQFLTAYCNRDTLPAVNAAGGGRHVWHWVATLDGTAHIDGYPPLQGPALVQILGAGQLGIHADLSLVLEDAWHPAPRPQIGPDVSADLAALRRSILQSAQQLNQLAGGLLLPG